MIIRIYERPFASLKNIMAYNDKNIEQQLKVEEDMDKPLGELLQSNVFGDTWRERYEIMRTLSRGDIQNPILHIPIRLPKGENLSNDEFTEITLEYMKRMKLDPENFPYQILRHYDNPNGEHVHLVISRVGYDGTVWNEFGYRKRSNEIRQELEQEYGLQQIQGKGRKEDELLSVVNMYLYRGDIPLKEKAKILVQNSFSESRGKGLDDLVAKLEENGIHPIFKLKNKGKEIAGVSYIISSEEGTMVFTGKQLGQTWTSRMSKEFPLSDANVNYIRERNRASKEILMEFSDKNQKELKERFIRSVPCSDYEKKIIRSTFLNQGETSVIRYFLNQKDKADLSDANKSYDFNLRGEEMKRNLLLTKVNKIERNLYVYEEWDKEDIEITRPFLNKNLYNLHGAYSWALRYPPVGIKAISREEFNNAFDFHALTSGRDYKKTVEEQRNIKRDFLKLYGLDDTTEGKRLYNTPLAKEQLDAITELTLNPLANKNQADLFCKNVTKSFSNYLNIQVSSIMARKEGSDILTEQLTSKFFSYVEASNLDANVLKDLYNVSRRNSITSLLRTPVSEFFAPKKGLDAPAKKTWAKSLADAFSLLMASPPTASQREKDEEDEEKKRKRKKGMGY